MNKADERKVFNALYQPVNPWTVIEDESPDFICTRDSRSVLGIEVTECFSNESDARLKKIPNYLDEITKGGKHRHVDDRQLLKVEDFIFDPDGPNRQVAKGIFQELPRFDERVNLLEATIRKKNTKAALYLGKAPEIDLAIRDRSTLFFFEDWVPFYFALSSKLDRLEIVNSPFREIFLVTSRKGGKAIKIPLKFNFLIEDFELFSKGLSSSSKFQDPKWRNDYFLRLAKCFWEAGYRKARLAGKKGKAAIVLGCWEVGVWEGRKRFQDYITNPEEMPHSEPIDEEMEQYIDSNDRDVSEFLATRAKSRCCFPCFFDLPGF